VEEDVADSPPYVVYLCPVCGEQSRGPGGHSVAGDDVCSNMSAHPKDGPSQPRLVRVAVEIISLSRRREFADLRRSGAERSREHWAAVRRESAIDRAAVCCCPTSYPGLGVGCPVHPEEVELDA
jgi:hypothetical protein